MNLTGNAPSEQPHPPAPPDIAIDITPLPRRPSISHAYNYNNMPSHLSCENGRISSDHVSSHHHYQSMISTALNCFRSLSFFLQPFRKINSCLSILRIRLSRPSCLSPVLKPLTDLQREDAKKLLDKAFSLPKSDPAFKLPNSTSATTLDGLETGNTATVDSSACDAATLVADLTNGDIVTLGHMCWLNDKVINAYFALICIDASRPRAQSHDPALKKSDFEVPSNTENGMRVAYANTFFYSALVRGGYEAVSRWRRTVHYFYFCVLECACRPCDCR